MSGRNRVLVVGDVMTDVIVKPEGPMNRGSDRRAAIRLKHGGSGANQAIWLGYMGAATVFAAKVNRADIGTYEALLARFGVAPQLSVDDDHPTGMLVSIVDPDGQRSFLTDRGANDWLEPADLPDALLDEVGILQVSGYALVGERSRATVLDFVAKARDRGVTVSVDPASASFLKELGPQNFLDWTAGAGLCFPNEDEAAVLAGSTDPVLQRERIGSRYSLTVIKRGKDGAEAVDPKGRCVAMTQASRVEMLDSTGAGDAFLAGFLSAWIVKSSVPDCLDRATAAGAQAVGFFGGQPTRRESAAASISFA